MGMTIEEISYRLQAMATMCTFQDAVGHDLSQKEIKLYNQAKDEAISTMRKYQKMKADYENRLKADMVAMLTDIQVEIKELWDSRYDVWLDNQYYIGKSDTLEEVDDVIQLKIDVLKVVSEPQKSEENTDA